MAHVTVTNNGHPVAAPLFEQFADFGVEWLGHGRSVAKLCGFSKQHFAGRGSDTFPMEKQPINMVVAEALRYFMGERWNNTTLAAAARVSPNTVRNFIEPESRQSGKSGKEPSGKLTELAAIADALGLEVSDLVTQATSEERRQLHLRRAGDYYARHGKLPPWAPSPDPATPEAAEDKRGDALAA